MNGNNQVPGSEEQSVALPTVTVYCTRPRRPPEGAHPHPNQILENDLLNRDRRTQLICNACGLPLGLGHGARYIPIQFLGRGGFGVTFLAVDLNVGSGPLKNYPRVVVKQLRNDYSDLDHTADEQQKIRSKVHELFQREAQTLRKLKHNNIPTLYDYFEQPELPDSRSIHFEQNHALHSAEKPLLLYLVQEHIKGIDLNQELIRRRNSSEGSFSEGSVKIFLKKLATILRDIHSGTFHEEKKQIIHRDIKASNIICSVKEVVTNDGSRKEVVDLESGTLHLIDFGAVKEVIKLAEAVSTHNPVVGANRQPTMIDGGGGFTAPEQKQGWVGPCSDLYSLAATCVHLLTDEKPEGFSNIPYHSNATVDPYDPRYIDWVKEAGISEEFADLLKRMLSYRPQDRYQSADEVLSALAELEREQQRQRELEEKRQRELEEKWRRVKQGLKAGGACLGLLFLLGVADYANIIPVPDFLSRQTDERNPLPSVANLISSGGNQNLDSSQFPLSQQFPRLGEGSYFRLKQGGMQAFARGDYKGAHGYFADIRRIANEQREQYPRESPEHVAATEALQDPTVLVYQNNAEVRLRARAGEPIYRVAVAVPLNLNFGQQMLFGLALLQNQAVNEEPGKRTNLEFVIADDRNEPQNAVAIAKALQQDRFEGHGILAVIGHYISRSTCEALKVYAPAGIPVVSPLSTQAFLGQDCKGAGWFFRTTSSTRVEAETLVDYLITTRQQSNPRVAAFYNSKDPYSKDLFERLRDVLDEKGGNVVEVYDLSSPIDAEVLVSQVRENVDALAVLPDGRAGNTAAFNQALAVIRANQGDKLILGSNPLYDGGIIEEAGGAANLSNRLIVATDWYQECEPDGPGSFVEEINQEWKGGVNRVAALSYEAAQAVRATLTPNVTPNEIRQKLSNLTGVESHVFSGRTISFDGNGDRNEIKERILTTPVQDNPDNPFGLAPGISCPTN